MRVNICFHDTRIIIIEQSSRCCSTMFSAVNVTFVQVPALVYAENHFPARNPMRWALIAEFAAKCMQELSTANDPLMVLGIKSSAMPADFHCSSDVCKNTFALTSSRVGELCSTSSDSDI